MTDKEKEKLHQILSSLWKNDDGVGKTYYNQALQDVQIAIDSLQEELVSEDLEEAAYHNCIDRLSKESIEDFKAGSQWKEQQMMAKAVETTFNVSLSSGLYDKLWIKGCKEGDKLLVIKKDEL